MSRAPKPEELLRVSHIPPKKDWMDPRTEFVPGTWGYPGQAKNLEILGMPNSREWKPADEDWKLPPNWKEIIHEGLKERLDQYRSLKVFLDICVRCGACADKCHFFIGGGDPKNMPVLRAELLRSIYRKDFTTVGRILGSIAGGRELTEDVIKEWFYYFHQCTECRRCSLFCPYGIDTAEITMMGRELLNLIGVNIDWILGAAANCYRTGNHLGLEPQAFKGNIDFLVDDIEEYTGVRVEPTFNRKGAEILFIAPSGDVFADPGIFTYMGYLMLFHHIGLDYTISTYASEGGNFGLFTNQETMKRLNAKMYAEAKRLGVKWIIGGECGHMWRVLHQYMDTMNGPADFLEAPKSPITGTVFENAKSTKMIHIVEFMADLIRNNKLKLNPKRNDYLVTTWHDSCNVSRGMGMFEEPRYVLKSVCNNFHEMPENTIREQTFCCGGGTGLNAGEFEYLRMMGGMPRAFAVKHVHEKYGVNRLVNICALDRAILPPLMGYWVPGVSSSGLTELVANALVMEGEHERTVDLRGEDIPGLEGEE